MTTRLQIKHGTTELNYEGDLTFTKDDLVAFIDKLAAQSIATPAAPATEHKNGKDVHKERDSTLGVASVSDIAQKLEVKTGRDLIIAACADLHFLQHKATFAAKDITASMREAKHFFKSHYSNNFQTTLKRLVKAGIVRSLGGDSYTLGHEAIEDLKGRLA